MDKRALTRTLYRINAIRFGEFRLKSGILSPFYIDLRVTVSYPHVLKTIAAVFWKHIQSLSFDCITGVPYTALPFAVALSLEHNLPMVLRRKEAKSYGTKKIIEGEYKKGNTCLIIEDVITSGASVFETIQPLESAGLIVSDIAVLIDREQGGKEYIERRGYKLHACLSVVEMFAILEEEGNITPSLRAEAERFIQDHPVPPPSLSPPQ